MVASDEAWRKARHDADNWNKIKNVASKAIGEKMKVRTQLVISRVVLVYSVLSPSKMYEYMCRARRTALLLHLLNVYCLSIRGKTRTR